MSRRRLFARADAVTAEKHPPDQAGAIAVGGRSRAGLTFPGGQGDHV